MLNKISNPRKNSTELMGQAVQENLISKIPTQVSDVLKNLEENNFEAFIVGGCVRDLLLGEIRIESGTTRGELVEPKDWDVTTNAKPEEVQKIFSTFAGATADREATFYENNFGTVGIKIPKFMSNGDEKREYDVVEVTTYRIESKYSDKRHPDEVKFAKTLEEDLSRRDFTVNALALKINEGETELMDFFGGEKDLKDKKIRAVGKADDRFNEDALRMMRAVRFNSQLDFDIEKETFEAIKNNSKNLKFISQERIKDELTKIILSDNPAEGLELLHGTGLLSYIIPELEKGYGVKQNRHHIYTIFKHCILSLKYCPSEKLEVRLASLLHDIAKPQTKRGEGEFATFYNHDHVGARVAEKILKRLRFSNEVIEKVRLLVDNHMFYYHPDEVTESSVRRLIQKVGLENMKDLMDLRIADRLGSGTPKAKPYKLRHLEYVIDKVSSDAVSVKMLKVSGNDLMKDLKMKPGPKIGAILDVLLSEVIEDATKNNQDFLLQKAKELDGEDLEKLRKMAKRKIEERKEEEDQEIKKKHWVK